MLYTTCVPNIKRKVDRQKRGDMIGCISTEMGVVPEPRAVREM